MAWSRTHIRLPSSPSVVSPPSSFIRKPSRLVGLCILASTLLTTYWLHVGGLGATAAVSGVHFGVEETWEGGVMGTGRTLGGPEGVEVDLVEPLGRGVGAGAGAAGSKVVEEVETSPQLSITPPVESLPVCKRTVLFRFAGLHGFGSEITLLLRIALLAEHYGYSLLLDSSAWNYGAYDDYFQTPTLPFPFPSESSLCRAPDETSIKRFKLVTTMRELLSLPSPPSNGAAAPAPPNWTKRNHVVWSSRDMNGVDASVTRLLVDGVGLETLHAEDLRKLVEPTTAVGFLSPEDTLPGVFETALARTCALARVLWTLNDESRQAADLLRRKLGLQGRKGEGGKRIEELLVAMHVRLGDKFLEADGRIGPVQFAPEAVAAAPPSPPSTLQPPGLNDALITSYFAATIDSVASIAKLPSLSTLLLSLPATATDAERVQVLSQAAHSWIGRPTLALMSDDAAAVRAFRLHPLAKHFNIVGTAEVASPPHSPSIESRSEGSAFVDVGDAASTDATTSNGSRQREKEGKNRLDIVKRTPKPFRHDQKLGGVKWHAAPARKVIPPGFNEITFNALPLSSRIASTRDFVRDVTVLSRHADAIVMTGSSNVGRLMMILFEAARVEKGVQGRREARSVDTRWFPTSRFS